MRINLPLQLRKVSASLSLLAALCVGWNGAHADVLESASQAMTRMDPLSADVPMAVLPSSARGDAVCRDSNASEALTLAQAMASSLCNSPEVLQAEIGVSRQAAGLGLARAAYFPTVTMGFSRNKGITETSFETSSFQNVEFSKGQNITFNYRILDFGTRGYGTDAARSRLESTLANYESVVQKVVTRAAQAFTDAAVAQAVYGADRLAEESAQKLTAIAQARQSRGVGAGFETLQAQAAQAKAALSTKRSRSAFETSIHQLAYLTGIQGVNKLRLEPIREEREMSLQVLKDFDINLTRAMTQHPTLRTLKLQLQALKSQVRSTLAEGLPTLDWSASRFVNGRPGQSVNPQQSVETLVSLTLNIPLFEGFGRIYKVKEAQTSLMEKESELQDTEQKLIADAERLRDELTNAASSLEDGQRWVELSEKSVASAQLRYERGISDVTEVINATTELNRSQKERIQVQNDWGKAYIGLLGHFAAIDVLPLAVGVDTRMSSSIPSKLSAEKR